MTVPSPVQNLLITTITTNSMSISFDPPATHPQCVKEYDIRIIDQDQAYAERETATPNLADTISGLEPCTNYLIKVRVISPTSLASPWRVVSNKTESDLASEPQAFGTSSVTQTSVYLQWYPPATNPNCVTEYVLTWDEYTVNIPSTGAFKMEYEVTGLIPCTGYTFSLMAKSSEGTSDPIQCVPTTECPF